MFNSDVSVDHLETKKQIDQLLEQFGEDHWLHSGSGSVVQNILGIQTVVDCKPEEASCSFSSSSSGVVVPDAKNEINIAKVKLRANATKLIFLLTRRLLIAEVGAIILNLESFLISSRSRKEKVLSLH